MYFMSLFKLVFETSCASHIYFNKLELNTLSKQKKIFNASFATDAQLNHRLRLKSPNTILRMLIYIKAFVTSRKLQILLKMVFRNVINLVVVSLGTEL